LCRSRKLPSVAVAREESAGVSLAVTPELSRPLNRSGQWNMEGHEHLTGIGVADDVLPDFRMSGATDREPGEMCQPSSVDNGCFASFTPVDDGRRSQLTKLRSP